MNDLFELFDNVTSIDIDFDEISTDVDPLSSDNEQNLLSLFECTSVNSAETVYAEHESTFPNDSIPWTTNKDMSTIVSLENSEPQPSAYVNSASIRDVLFPSLSDNANDFSVFMTHPNITDGSVVTPNDLSTDGTIDDKNGLIVVGDVANDIQYVDKQTAGSCSLMAQEQFVNRYIGRSLPEDYLEWQAEQWGVYSPEMGTNYWGQTKILDHFEIPYERDSWANIEDVERALDSNHDLIVGVDARNFYNDPTIPPGSGHAVAIVGKGIDPTTHNTAGYYFTDSNVPGTVRFMEVSSFKNAWQNDMISIPNVEKGAV